LGKEADRCDLNSKIWLGGEKFRLRGDKRIKKRATRSETDLRKLNYGQKTNRKGSPVFGWGGGGDIREEVGGKDLEVAKF